MIRIQSRILACLIRLQGIADAKTTELLRKELRERNLYVLAETK